MKLLPGRRTETALLVLAAVLAGFHAAPVVAAADNAGVGVVAGYRPSAGRFTFSRPPANEQVAVRIGTVVVPGDRVKLPAGASIVVHLASGEVQTFSGAGEFTVPKSPTLGRLAKILSSLDDVFDAEYRLAGIAASRGGEKCGAAGATVADIEVPILMPGARIAAGERDLPLAWRGGCAPFSISVLSSDKTPIHRETIDGRQVRLDDLPLREGSYSVLISDAGGRRFTATVNALAAAPAIPADIAADSSPLGVIAQAVWLSEQDGGLWRLESFERLRPLIRAGDALAGTLGDGLLWGQSSRE